MSRLQSFIVLSVIICTILAPLAAAQGALPFTIRVQQADTVSDIGDGGEVLMETGAVGQPVTASVTMTYLGVEATQIDDISLTGSLDFSVSGALPPFPLERNDSFTLTVQYLPTTSELTAGALTIAYAVGDTSPTFVVNLTGAAPEFAYTFTPQGGNTTQVVPEASLAFPDTPIDSTATATVTMTNRGSATGVVNSIATTDSVFQVTGLPLLPTEVEAGAQLSFTVSFTPDRLNNIADTLAIGLFDGTATFALQGVGTGASFAYETVQGSSVLPLLPDQTISIPDTLVSETNSLVVRVRNDGNADGQVSSVSVTGNGLTLSGLPFLPAVLGPGESLAFTLEFTPTEVAPVAGALKIGDDEFTITADGVGALLAYHVAIGEATTPIDDKGTVNFTPAAVGETSSAVLLITNTGTTVATINSISLAKIDNVFSLSGLPALPLTLASGETATFKVDFAPAVVGGSTDTLKIDNDSFTLSGSGNPPPALPSFQFEGTSGAQGPRQQPAVGLTLGESYSLPITGTLTLDFTSDVFRNDPSVQFATGGRTVGFTIPTGASQAVFDNGSTQVGLQTGTVAGTITLTPSFKTEGEGGVDLTPEDPLTQTMSVAKAAPQVNTVVISQQNPGALTLQITGFATTRSISQMTLQFTPAAGESVATTSLALSVEDSFVAWYQSSQSTQYGSQFTVSVQLQFAGDVNEARSPVNTVQSISVTLANEVGTSNALSVTVPEG